MAASKVSPWDLTALLNAADPKASLPERHLWLIRLLEWLRHAPIAAEARATPTPVLRLKHLLGVLDRHAEHRDRVAELLRRLWHEVDNAALLADFGFAPRMHLWGELARRIRAHVLPLTPATTDLGELFALLFPHADDADWLRALDVATLERLRALAAPPGDADPARWREPFLDAIVFLASAVRAAGFAPELRLRMSPQLLAEQPFRQIARVAEQLAEQARAHDAATADAAPAAQALLLQQAQYLRALLQACRSCADSVHDHLEAHGVSVDIVFELEQLRERTHRIDALLGCALSPQPAREIAQLVAELVHTADQRRSVRALLSRHYSLLARRVAERGAETGERYIARDAPAYRRMLRAATGGGAVLAGTTLIKLGLAGLALSAFWGGFWAGVNYAASFVLIQLLHYTVATKQPAMTAPAMAERLGDLHSDDRVEAFVDEVANLIRSQAAGIVGNLVAVVPVVLAVQWCADRLRGAPLVDAPKAAHVLESLTLLGPTALYAALTGVLLFASSLIAGWAENWFVWHRLDSAIAWNPRIVARLGTARAARWAAFWRGHVSGFASNVSLGLMLGIVPAVALFFGVPLEVRHVTLSAGQLAAAAGADGAALLGRAAFWWCVAGIGATAVLNLGVSFFLAFKVALRSRGIRPSDRERLYRAIRARLRTRPLSFVSPSR